MRHLTATQAAAALGVNEKTVRRWVQDGKLTAHHVASNRMAIAERDVERLKQQRAQYQQDAQTHPDMPVQRDLAQAVKALSEHYGALSIQFNAFAQEMSTRFADFDARMEALERAISYLNAGPIITEKSVSPVAVPKVPKKRQNVTTEPQNAPSDIPPGSVPARTFAEQYGINRTTLLGHLTKGIAGERLEALSFPKPNRPREHERWFTPQQQQDALAFWQRHHVRHTMPGHDQNYSPERRSEAASHAPGHV